MNIYDEITINYNDQKVIKNNSETSQKTLEIDNINSSLVTITNSASKNSKIHIK